MAQIDCNMRQFCKAVFELATFLARIVIYLNLIRRAGTLP